MPAVAPTTGETVSAALAALGERLRAERRRLRVSAITAAEAAGMSRVTLHRIERGEPSVTMGAYANAAAALGLALGVTGPPPAAPGRAHPVSVPQRIQLADTPAARAAGLAAPGRHRGHGRGGTEPLRTQLAAHRPIRVGAARARADPQLGWPAWAGAGCLFEREHHRRVARVLKALDARLLHGHQCLFGGGTSMTLRYGEYRESVDIDFLVSHREGYRVLREALSGPTSIQALCRPGAEALTPTREVRADQYGLRTMLRVDEVEIKFEIVLEARITLDAPGDGDLLCGVATLSPLDMATSKLLANSDRWADDSVLCRDLIDLAMMQPSQALLREAIAKAEGRVWRGHPGRSAPRRAGPA